MSKKSFETPEEFLAHHGVKGQKWGIVNDDETTGVPLSKLERSVRTMCGIKSKDNESLNAKYGKESITESPRKGLTDNQKKLLVIGGIAAVLVGGVVASHYLDKSGVVPTPQEAATNLSKFWSDYSRSSRRAMNLSIEDIDKMGGPLHFSPGSIFKRVSTTAENHVNPGGFFAAFKDEDVNRYKAVLPTFWKQWGESTANTGFVVNFKNNVDVKAPSVRQAFDIWERVIANDPKTAASMNIMMRNSKLSPREIALKTFGDLGTTFRDRDMNDVTRHYFNEVKKAGYNALIDHNDAGKLAESPVRLLDGSIFSITGHDVLSSDLIKQAQENIVGLSHAEIFLAYYGVKTNLNRKVVIKW